MEELKLYLNGIVCVTCLSSDRELRLIENVSQIQELLPNIRINNGEDKMCWECRSILINFTRFREKASEAQKVFDNFVEGNLKSIKSFSNLKWELTVDGVRIKMKDQSSRVEIQSEETEQTQSEEEMEEFVNNCLYEEVKHVDDDQDGQEIDSHQEMMHVKHEPDDSMDSMDVLEDEYGDDDDILLHLPDKFNIADEETDKIIESTLEAFLEELTKRKKTIQSLSEINNDAIESDYGVNENEDSYMELQNFRKIEVPKSRALKRYNTISRKKINKEEMDEMLDRERENTCYKNAYFKCEKCVYGYENVNQYTEHLIKHDESQGPELCGICQQRFPSKKAYVDHYMHHFMAFYCIVCGYTSRFLRFLTEHQKKNECHNKKYPIWFYCDQCDEKFALESLLTHHKKTMHQQEYTCKYCNKTFAKEYNRKKHEQIHIGRESVQCDICNKFFVNKSSFQLHLKTIHEFSPRKSVYCKICNKYYRNKNAYDVHKRSHAAADS